jgi:hypothetical protein
MSVLTVLGCPVKGCDQTWEASEEDPDSTLSIIDSHLRGIAHLLPIPDATRALLAVREIPTERDDVIQTADAPIDAPTDLGPTRTELLVSTGDLRNALRAVVPHAGQDKEVPVLQRVRFYIQGGNIMVAATNRYTVGVGLVSIWDNTYDDDDAILDVTPGQVSEILTMFKTPKDKDDDAGDDDLRLRITDRFLVITDMAGLFPGKEVTWPRVANEEGFPNLRTLIGKMVATAGTASAATMWTSGKFLGLFGPAAKVYDQPLVIEPTSEKQGALVITVGESFLGALMPIKPSDESVAEAAEWRRGWDARLGEVDLGTGELDAIVPSPRESDETEAAK